MRFSDIFAAVVALSTTTAGVLALDPTEIYDGGFKSTAAPVLRIANGGAGGVGLIKLLADSFIQESVQNGSAPFRIGWILSDTTFTIKHLQSGDADVGITYNPAAEKIAGDQGLIDSKTWYLFRDHFLIAGPKENPANIDNSSDVSTIMAKLFQAADRNSANTTLPTRWLSRFDKSATNIKESQLWLAIGQAPWAMSYSTWYHQYIDFPIKALTAAIQLKEYTLTDRSTYLSIPCYLTQQMTIYKASGDDANDPLLNPAHLLIGKKAQNASVAYRFAEWATRSRGQKVITDFRKNGMQLYSGAPPGSNV